MSDWCWCLAMLLFVATARLPVCFSISDVMDKRGDRNKKDEGQDHEQGRLENKLATLLLLQIVASPDTNTSYWNHSFSAISLMRKYMPFEGLLYH